jgi:phosphatidylethanolamine-binding protein (PEBP) family uncharacterized protein
MAGLGTLLSSRRAGPAHLAWNLANFDGPSVMTLASPEFSDGGAIPIAQVARRIGGSDISPALEWSPPPSGTAQLLVVIEDADSPTTRPFVHCLALLDPDLGQQIPAGALSKRAVGSGVEVLRSALGTGYRGPGPLRGHGPHHYHFELFALATPLGRVLRGRPIARAQPRVVLASAVGPVLGRGRLIGVFAR